MHKVHHHSPHENAGIVLCRFLAAKKIISSTYLVLFEKRIKFFFTGGGKGAFPPGTIPKINFGFKLFPVFQTGSAFFIFSRSGSLVFLKSTDKITQIIKAVAIGNIRYGIVCGGKLVAGLLNALAVQIVHRSLMGHFRKEAAEILGGHGYGIRQLPQGKRRSIVLFNKFHYLLQLQDPLVIPARFGLAVKVVMITKNNTEKVVKLSDYRKLISRLFFIHRLKKRIYCRKNIRITLVKVVKNQNILVDDLLDVIRAYGIQLQKYVHIKDNALIDTIYRNSRM